MRLATRLFCSFLFLATLVRCGLAAPGEEAGDLADGQASQALAAQCLSRLGIVGVAQLDAQDFPQLTSVSAGYWRIQQGNPCTTRTVGACEVSVCVDTEPGHLGQPVSAGAVTVTGAQQAPIVITPDAKGYYPVPPEQEGLLWVPGETVWVKAAGATLPAYTTGQPFPKKVSFTAPALSGPVMADRTQPLPLAWTVSQGLGQPVLAMVNLYQPHPVNGVPGHTQARCNFPASAGAASVPAQVMGAFVSGAELGLYVGSATIARATPGGFPVRSEAVSISGVGGGLVH